MSISPAAVKIELAKGSPTILQQKGGFIGEELVWDGARRRIRGFRRQRDSSGGSGMTWNAALKAVMLAWEIGARDIARLPAGQRAPGTEGTSVMYGAGEETGFEWDIRDSYSDEGRLLRPATVRGQWGLAAPDWNIGKLAWFQGDTDPTLEWYLESLTPIPANRPMIVFLRREAAVWEQHADALGSLYTAVRFGRGWELRFPKWATAQLRRRKAGQWEIVDEWDWREGNLYPDSQSESHVMLAIMPIDGKLQIHSNLGGDDWVYAEDRPITIPEGPIAFTGNGGCCGIGLHEMEFDDREDNWLIRTVETRLGERPSQAPTPIVIGSAPAGTTVEVRMLDADGEAHEPDTRTRYALAMRLAPDETARTTPAVRMFGLDYPPVVELPDLDWTDVSDQFEGLNGARAYDIHDRVIRGHCDVTLDNARGDHSDVRGARVARVWMGRDGLHLRYAGACALRDAAREMVPKGSATYGLRDRMEALKDIRVGRRRPLDGMKVCDAIGLALLWGHFHTSEIGVLFDSGNRLPASGYADTYWGGSATAGILDRSPAAAMINPQTTVWDLLAYLMSFDYGTYCGFNMATLKVDYVQISSVTPVRTFTEAETLDGQEAIRRQASRQPRVWDIVTSLRVESRDRKSGEPISASFVDRDALTDEDSVRFRGGDHEKTERDRSLGEQRHVNLKCRHEAEWARRLREERSFEALGQPELWPPTAVTIHETGTGEQGTYVVLGVTDEIGKDRNYRGRIDAAIWLVSAA